VNENPSRHKKKKTGNKIGVTVSSLLQNWDPANNGKTGGGDKEKPSLNAPPKKKRKDKNKAFWKKGSRGKTIKPKMEGRRG